MAEEGKKQGKNINKILIIILAVVMFMVVSSVIAYMVALNVTSADNSDSPEKQKEEKEGIIVSGGQFTTNLNDKGIIKITLEYEVENEETKKEANDKKSEIKDKVNSVLRSQKYEDVKGYVGMEKLRSSIKQELRKIFKKGKLLEVYITDIIVL